MQCLTPVFGHADARVPMCIDKVNATAPLYAYSRLGRISPSLGIVGPCAPILPSYSAKAPVAALSHRAGPRTARPLRQNLARHAMGSAKPYAPNRGGGGYVQMVAPTARIDKVNARGVAFLMSIDSRRLQW